MIIDMHAHTSNSRMHHLHVEWATLDVLEERARVYGVSRIYLMATYFPLKGTGLKNKVLLERILNRPLFKAFGSLDVMNNLEEGIKEIEDLITAKQISGIKLYPGYQNFHPSDSTIFPLYDLAEAANLPVMFHGGELHGCCPRREREKGNFRCGRSICLLDQLKPLSRPRKLAGAVRNFPNVRFIVSHLANPYFRELRELMEKFPNVYTDFSGQWLSGSREDTPRYHNFVYKEVQEFLHLPNGHDRLCFATDFPIQSYEDSFRIVESLDLRGENLEKILSKNALRILGFEGGMR